jgi:hypothetical protein
MLAKNAAKVHTDKEIAKEAVGVYKYGKLNGRRFMEIWKLQKLGAWEYN